jgi:hypothetical protein
MARATRADEIRQERRMKPGSTVLSGIKLHVPEEGLDRNTYEYHWANDKDGRVEALYAQDWDPVTEPVKPDADGVGTVQSKVAGAVSGKPFSAVLMRKRKDWYLEDQKRKNRALDETEAAIKRGADSRESDLHGLSYVPIEGGNRIER